MIVNLYVYGQIKEAYLNTGIDDYLKRLKHYRTVNIIELKDLQEPKNASPLDIEHLKEKEAAFFFDKVQEGPIIALTLEGKTLDSEAFASWLEHQESTASKAINFVIGASNGLAPSILKAASAKISFSALTFPHGLFRLIFLEQLYRAYKINHLETYHK